MSDVPTTRLGTSYSRPGTARPQTSASSRYEGTYIVAIVESRGVGREVGIAALDKETGRVSLVQVNEASVPRHDMLSSKTPVSTACRLADLRQDAPSSAASLSMLDSCARYFSRPK